MKQSALMAPFFQMDLKEKQQITLYILSGLMLDQSFQLYPCDAEISSIKPTLLCFWE